MGRGGKAPIVRWTGTLSEAPFDVRVMVFALIVCFTGASAFTQMGFVGVGLPGSYVTYAVALLMPVAVAALLFGPLLGALEGLIGGSLLFLHANLQPIDYYEVISVTPLMAFVMFTLAGFLLGVLFAIALRNGRLGWRRVLYIALVCVIVSALFSAAFFFNVVAKIVIDILPQFDAGMNIEASDVSMRLSQSGNLFLQVWIDAVEMAVPCLIVDLVARKVAAHRGTYHLNTTFRAWLFAGLALAFLLTSAITFAVITEQEKNDAFELLDSETSYLCKQIAHTDRRAAELDGILAAYDIDVQTADAAQLAGIADIRSNDGLLEGYTKEVDGTVAVIVDNLILITDDGNLEVGQPVADQLGNSIVLAIEQSIASGELQPVLFDPTGRWRQDDIDTITMQIAYLLAKEQSDRTVMMILPTSMVFANRPYVMVQTLLTALGLMLMVYFMASRMMDRLVMKPIDQTNAVLERITEGDLEAQVVLGESTEFESLAGGINTTVDTLKSWIAEAGTRMDSELAAAKAIQTKSLPTVFPPYPDNLHLDVFALMHPAKEVGGDFYDFFLVGDNCTTEVGKLGFVVADVSGKGVPAALFMMAAMTAIRSFVELGVELGEAIENANHRLCDGNDTGMFATAFIGVMDYATGHVVFVNAGHNPPLLWRTEQWQWVREKSGLPLGLFDGLPYTAHEIDLRPGDEFLLYTDGVTEAMSTSGELYGEGRLEQLASENRHLHPHDLVGVVRQDVARHAAGAEQSDDITILSVEYGVAPELARTIVVPSRTEELDKVRDFVHAELDQRLCPVRAQNQLDIALEELFVNVCHYAYPEATEENPGEVRVSCSYSAEPPSVTVTIVDDGVPFDPLAKKDAVTPDDILDIPIGGLGILMAKKSVDEMRYERDGGSNIVTIIKKW